MRGAPLKAAIATTLRVEQSISLCHRSELLTDLFKLPGQYQATLAGLSGRQIVCPHAVVPAWDRFVKKPASATSPGRPFPATRKPNPFRSAPHKQERSSKPLRIAS